MKKLMALAAIAMIAFGIEAGTVNAAHVTAETATICKTLKEGLRAGMKNGMKDGMKNGLKDGLKNGLKNGLVKGMKNGKVNGEKK